MDWLYILMAGVGIGVFIGIGCACIIFGINDALMERRERNAENRKV